MTDKELQLILSRMANSDVNALAEVYGDMKIPIFTIIYRIVGNKAEAEDVMQEFFVRLYKNAQNITVKKPRAYIFQMARNMALDNLRWQKRA
ncbi:MAG: sigma factor, partial [Bacillota bacterium]